MLAILKQLICFSLLAAMILPFSLPAFAEPPLQSEAELSTSLEGSYGFRAQSEGEGLTAQLAASSGSQISGKWNNAMTLGEGVLSLSFTVRRLSPAAPAMALRIRASSSLFYRLFTVTAEQELRLFNERFFLAALGDEPIHVRIDLAFSLATSAEAGRAEAEVYLDGAYLDRFTDTHSLKAASDFLQFYCGSKASDAVNSYHIGAHNGTYLYDGVGEGETKTVLNASDKEGYYGMLELSDLRAVQNPVRRTFIYSGASIRLSENAENSGLRFTFGVDRAWFDAQEGATVGAILIPTDKLDGGFSPSLLKTLTKGKDYAELPDIGFSDSAPEADAETYVYSASLVDLLPQNYARAITAVGFTELASGERIYTAALSRSVSEVARNYTASPDFEKISARMRELVCGYVDRVAFLSSTDEGLSLFASNWYTAPYTLSEIENGFLLAGSISMITAIVLDGAVYTSGWLRSDGEIRVTLEKKAP